MRAARRRRRCDSCRRRSRERRIFLRSRRAIPGAGTALNALDAATGDGDHGAAMRRGLEAVAAAEPGTAAQAFRGAAGGTSGTLFGALVGGLEAVLGGDRKLSSALTHAAGQVAKLGMAKRGDKTMLDALIPAAEAAGAAPNGDAAQAAAEAARRGGRSDHADGGAARSGALRRERRNRTRGRRREVRGRNALGVREVLRGEAMKKLVNAPDRIVDDMIDGFVAAYPGLVARGTHPRVVRRAMPAPGGSEDRAPDWQRLRARADCDGVRRRGHAGCERRG